MVKKYPQATEVLNAIKSQACYKAQELAGGSVMRGINNRALQYSGGFATVFPFVTGEGKKIAVRCWTNNIGESQVRSKLIIDVISKLKSKYFVSFSYINDALIINGELHPIIIMDWVEGDNLKEYLKKNIHNPFKILKVAEDFRIMMKYFHSKNIAHGDLQHENIKILDSGDIVVIDYDSMYVEGLANLRDLVKGKPEYQHPAREKNVNMNSCLDYFSEIVIYVSLLAYAYNPLLWDNDTEWLVFSKEDFQSPQLSSTFNELHKIGNHEITLLANYIVECLKREDILLLSSLEDLLQGKLEKMSSDIIDKF